jgi:hypothetical protein
MSALLGFFQASAAVAMQESMSMQATATLAFGASMCNFSTGYIELYPLSLETISPMLTEYINTTMINQTAYTGASIQPWVNLFTYWGTGYMKQLMLGVPAESFLALP